MTIICSIVTFFSALPGLHLRPSHSSETRTSSFSSSTYATFNNRNQPLFWDNNRRMKYYKSTRRFLVRSGVEPGVPVPPAPPFNLINWILGTAVTVAIPLFTNKWTSLLKIKNDVENAVEVAEDVMEAVENVAERVEKAAEDIADDLPEGGGLRKAVDFVEQIAERVNRAAEKVGDFIDKVQEFQDKVEDYFESSSEDGTTHDKQNEENNTSLNEEEDRAQDPTPKQEKNVNGQTHKHH